VAPIVAPAPLRAPRERQEPRKYYLSDGVEVRVIDDVVQELDASGRRLRTVQLTTYTGEQVKTLTRDPDALRLSWVDADERARIVAALEERGITLEHLAAVMERPDADPFDLLCHLAFSAPLRKRTERAEWVRKEKHDFFARYAPEARNILNELLNQYAEFGSSQFVLPDVLHLPVIERHGNVTEIAAFFGGADQLREAVTELHELLYAA
jgi:type I restriction enzyme R subunit